MQNYNQSKVASKEFWKMKQKFNPIHQNKVIAERNKLFEEKLNGIIHEIKSLQVK